MKTIKGFENEKIEVSDFGEWIGKDYIDYKFEYKNNQKLIKTLLEENQELEKQFEAAKEVAEEHMKKWVTMQAQQKEFIKYLTSTIEELECDDFDDERMKELLLQNIITYKEILSKYKEIVGDENE